MKKLNILLAVSIGLFGTTTLFGQTGGNTVWFTSGNNNILPTEFIGTLNNADFRIQTNSLDRMVVKNSGSVGIGTTTPTGQFHVNSTDKRWGIYGTSSYNNGAIDSYGIYMDCSNLGGGSATSGKFSCTSTGSSSTGTFGYADGGTFNYGVYGVATSVTNKYAYGVYGSASGTGANYAGFFVGKVHVSDKVSIGIPSVTPAFLHVNSPVGETAFAVQIDNLSKLKVNSNGSVSVGGTTNGPTDGMYIKGNVGIGTGNIASGYKLSVKGKIMCEEMKVQLQANWPDYVFAPQYNCLSLSEVENYINEHKHLPGIPSAETIKNDGLSVGDMQARMMEKIEELTLYVIALEKKVKTLEAK
ncbi:MAG: hypothetical protein ABI723_18450 [Bacteroidia bacterium]